jgi:beta-lactamase class D
MKKIEQFMAQVISRNPGETEFHQAVQEVVESVMPYIEANPKYDKDGRTGAGVHVSRSMAG